jgi:hypothetical protein
MLQIKGGAPYHWKDSNTVAIAVIVIVAMVTFVVAIVVVIAVADAVTIAVIIVTGCCHCCKDNKFLTVFVMSHVFLQPQTGNR